MAIFQNKSISNSHILITGGANGIGREMTESILGQQEEGTENRFTHLLKQTRVTVIDCQQSNYTHKNLISLNLKDKQQINKAISLATEKFGPIDIIINNAGVVTGKDFLDSTDEEIESTFKVNTLSHFWIIKQILPKMIKAKAGHIVTISSVAGTVGGPKCVDYCSSKFASFGFHESLRVELKSLGHSYINTTLVCPYLINTEMFKGATSKCSLMLPILDKNWVARRILLSILQNEEMVNMPFWCNFGFAAKSLLPVWFYDLSLFVLGIGTVMSSFKGSKRE